MEAIAAVDLGATSGRVILGRIEGDRLETRHVARFANEPVRTSDGLHWNLLSLYQEVLRGLAAAERELPGRIGSIGIDSWAVDYGLLRGGRLLGVPYHYRDERTATGVAAVHAKIPPAELYARNGLQHLPFNTLFQLAAEGEFLGLAARMLLVPDLLSFWLTGAELAERTNASTTGLLDPRTAQWDTGLAEQLGIPARLLPPLVDAGTRVAPLGADAARVVGRAIPLTAVGSHDTASAVAAIPASRPDFAYISCGTWGLVGLELDSPVLSAAAFDANFTNEGGIDGRVRFLHNVMGLWLLSESLRQWEPAATEAQRSSLLGELLDGASGISGDLPLFDVNDPSMLAPGDIPGRIRLWYRQAGERVPEGRVEIVRCIVESLAQAFVDAVRQGAALADREVSVIHIVGGGSQNALLCQSIADRSGLRVLAGPTEATAMGNMLVQARALGQIGGTLEAIRGIVAGSARIVEYAPSERRR